MWLERWVLSQRLHHHHCRRCWEMNNLLRGYEYKLLICELIAPSPLKTEPGSAAPTVYEQLGYRRCTSGGKHLLEVIEPDKFDTNGNEERVWDVGVRLRRSTWEEKPWLVYRYLSFSNREVFYWIYYTAHRLWREDTGDVLPRAPSRSHVAGNKWAWKSIGDHWSLIFICSDYFTSLSFLFLCLGWRKDIKVFLGMESSALSRPLFYSVKTPLSKLLNN